jgi:hypothetical protein
LIEQLNENILKLLIASDELLLEELVECLRDYLIEYQSNWIRNNYVLILNTACKLASCKTLRDFCFEHICFVPQILITSDNFLSLDKDIFYDLLEREDLLINEIVAWDHLIKWGIEQTPGLGNENCDRNKWSNEEYEALKETLYQFIPLIRFVEITLDDFNDKIKPYKDIFPNQIYEEIEEFYNKGTSPRITTTLPPRIGYFNSVIIKPKLTKIILKWINKEDLWISRYRFNLIYRGSINGFSTESFKNKCKGQVESLVIIKVKQTNKIFGGYSSIGFHSIGNNVPSIHGHNVNSKFYHSSDNFIFSFENDEDTQNMKISRVINYDEAIHDTYNTGFSFGFDSLFMYANRYLFVHNNSHAYEDNLNTYESYDIEEIEVFSIYCYK